MSIVDSGVTLAKFQRELAQWEANSDHVARGWLMLAKNEAVPAVELAFLAKVTASTGSAPLPVIPCAVRLQYDDYDVLPPSLTFIDPFSRQPALPHVRAFVFTPEGPRNVLIDTHPVTSRPFLCLPGIREYHTHPQHTGDNWLLHRNVKAGSLVNICDRIWRLMIRNIIGLNITMQTLPTWPLQAQLVVHLSQGDLLQGPKPASSVEQLLAAQ